MRRSILFLLIAILPASFPSASGPAQVGSPVLPRITAPAAAVPPDFFGMHVEKASKPLNYDAFVLTPWPQVPFHTWRLWDSQTTWRILEPIKGSWRFRLLDQYVALAEEKHVNILLTLGQTPSWAASRPNEPTYFHGAASEPASLDDWDDYVRTVATRYKGRIHAYEIWNEPNLPMFYSGSVQTLAEMSQRAVAIFRQIDPTITVVSPGITRDPTYLDRYIKAGGAKGVDVIGFHFYVHGQPEEIPTMVTKVDQVLADNGLSSRPIWNTESGWGLWRDGVTSFTPELAAAFVARTNILFWVSGVSRFYWYSWDNQNWVTLHMTEKDSTTETPAAQAYRTTEDWMLGSRFQVCQPSPDNVWTCILTRGGRPARIIWAPEGNRTYTPSPSLKLTTEATLSGQTLPLPKGAITIGPSPILLY